MTEDKKPLGSRKFVWVGPNWKESEEIARPSISYWQDAMNRLRKNKAAMVCLVLIVAVTLFSLIIPLISPFTMNEQHLMHVNQKMFTVCPDTGHMHWFGTDSLGRDLLVRLCKGIQVSMYVAVTAVFVNVIIGLLYGGISGYVGGAVDNVMMRAVEVINGIPYLMIVILLMMILEPGATTIIIAYALVGWTGMARLVRGQILSLKGQEYVLASKALGASGMRMIMHHLLPNSLSVIIVNITLAIPSAIFTEAFLSFIGLGIPIPLCSLGMLASDGARVFQLYPWQLLVPAMAISVIMLSFNLLGDGLRDAFDPKLRR
ncbi:MAG: ABC transporter permease [Oscillospiraceae bacterium]|nr:ABC transporter permease [Oscillospiraceae bacterium]